MGVVEPEAVARQFMLLLIWLFAAASVSAEQLPIRTYTTTDGLAEDNVTRIVRDSRGFIWFCTGEGLSKFDGYFANILAYLQHSHRRTPQILLTA